ncbi:peptide chain release factor N(5)-glutamine methyltransferase [Hujiaoplasma nucleasis]|uniref:Release factor glutamine methyltransferase n=1 Tax=Hujiaoplasma nucleasis TaxID=2725268 RepID=A0A7L6N1Z1_9MOLU|nr:peptide chain release factor N(5)-glutamine methyltransferase [Hujiaoplasma nucleasis]QLY40276.1 peptide chain release factor N(5)-glutamine methyltransferase [Hujiaoplasma nucleasis]
MATYKQVLQDAKKQTRKVNKETSATELLMLHFSKLEPTDLYLKYDEPMPQESQDEFYKALSLYLDHNKPVQQIIGYVYFYGYKFKVTDQALIPRFETEELVANVLMLYDEYFSNRQVSLVDIGTGSGCLAISLAKEEAHFKVSATDISHEALALAKENADLLNADIDFYQGDMIDPVKNQKFDILVSNPPYIPTIEQVDPLILDNEPHLALFGGEDGLKFYKQIINDSKTILKDKAMMAFEHAYDKAEEINKLVKETYPQAEVFTLKDMQGLDRMTFVLINLKKKENQI